MKLASRVKTAPAKVRLVREGDNPWYELTLLEGKNRQIRKMFEEIGHHVEKIKRVRYGPLSLDIPPGEFRRLSAAEVEKLKASIRRKQNRPLAEKLLNELNKGSSLVCEHDLNRAHASIADSRHA